MLILTRRIGESIIIGDGVVVKVLAVRSGQIKLGVEAPKDLPVHREEIYHRIRDEGVEAPRDDDHTDTALHMAG